MTSVANCTGIPAGRVRLISAASSGEKQEEFAQAVGRGLSAVRKTLPCRFIYDAKGSELFERICGLPEYYLTRAEREILTLHVGEIADCVPADGVLVELGSGSADKTTILISALLDRRGSLPFFAIDISRAALADSAASLSARFKGLTITGICGEYREGLDVLTETWTGPKCILWLGSSVGNFERDNALGLLRCVRDHMGGSDALLVGIDLKKDADVLEAAYDDEQNITAQFNLNILTRINRELGGDFVVSQFRHDATYNAQLGRVESHLVSTCDQKVRLADLDMSVSFVAGESIHTENSYKYSVEDIDGLARSSGFSVPRRWFDRQERFSLNLFSPAAVAP